VEKLDQEECLGIWDLRAGQESLECLEKLDDRALLDPEACLDKRAQMDQGDLQESEDHPELKVCLVWRAVREPLVLMDQMVRLDHPDQMDLLETEEYLVYLVPLAQPEQLANKDLRENEEILANQESRALRDPLGLLVLPVLLVSVANGEKKVHQANREHLGWEDVLVTRVHLVLQE